MADETTSEPTDRVDVTHAPTLPGLELPEYHGRTPSGMKTSINGAGNRLNRAHEIGERVVLVVEARAKKAGHEETDDGLVYAETLKVVDLFEVTGDAGKRLLSTVRQAYREADDERVGRAPLAADGVDLATASDGTVLTPDELAELRGDPARAIADERTMPVVVVYSDGARELWPDDFEAGAARPKAGDRFELEGGDGGPAEYVYAREILHAETGETLEAWTDQQEHDRLLELERQAAEAERAEAEASAPDGDEDDETAVAFYRLECADGSVIESGSPTNPFGPTAEGERVVAVTKGGDVMLVADHPKAGDTPPLPGEDGYDAGLEPLDPGGEPVEPDPLADVIPFPEEPTPEDFALVDNDLDVVRVRVAEVTDVAQARRLLEAEKRGRGRSLKTRKGAVDAITARIAELEQEGPADGS